MYYNLWLECFKVGRNVCSTRIFARWETKEESSHLHVEKHDEASVKVPEFRVYERNTRSQQRIVVEEEETK